MILIVRGTAYELTSDDGRTMKKREIEELRTNQEESDTKMILYSIYGSQNGYSCVKIRSPDSDVFFILLHHAKKIRARILFDTGSGNKKRLLDVKQIADGYGPVQCEALLALHAFTGCDTASAFKGIGKIKPIKIFLKDNRYENVFATLGNSWETEKAVLNKLEEFTCCLYGFSKVKSVDLLRYTILKKKCNDNDQIDLKKSIDLNTLPPCQSSLHQHIKRAVYQTGVWKRANENFIELPPAEENGWSVTSDTNHLEPLWCEGPVLPEDLFDLMEDDSDTDDDKMSDIPDFSDSSDNDDF